MRNRRLLLALCGAVVALAGICAGVGLFSGGGAGPFTFTNVHGQTVEMYGVGIYDNDSLLKGSGQRGVDLVTLLVVLPLLVLSAWRHHRGSLRGTLLLTGALVWCTYVGISYLAGVAQNELFFAYVALFSTSLFALMLAFVSLDDEHLATRIDARTPRRAPAAALLVCGAVTLAVWSVNPLQALLSGEAPSELESYTSLFTHGFDLAVLVPLTVWSGILILRRDHRGYALGVPLIVFAALLAPMLTAMTILQVQAGVHFATGAIVGPIGGFAVLAALAVWVLVLTLRHLGPPSTVVGDPLRNLAVTRDLAPHA